MRFIFRACLLALAATLIYSAPARTQGADASRFDGLRITLNGAPARIPDALSLQLPSGDIVRLANIDIPGAFDAAPSETAIQAHDWLKAELTAKPVRVYQPAKTELRTNRYGHQVGYTARVSDSFWIEQALVARGLAFVAPGGVINARLADLYRAEGEARAQKKGLWQENSGFAVLSPGTAQNAIGRFAIVEGAVKSAALAQNTLYLNFGADWRKDFTVSVAPEQRRAFSKRNIDLLSFAGKTIRVRGIISEKNGPAIELTNPDALEIVSPAR